jgi:hypothetical protein
MAGGNIDGTALHLYLQIFYKKIYGYWLWSKNT